jgi:hypothetical protein
MAANLLKAGYPVVVQQLHATMAAGREDDRSMMAKTVFDIAGVQ